MPQPQEDAVQTPHRANPHHRHNNNDGDVLMERPKGGWDDAPGSPHRVPLVSNNNGSPRLTNRIANIYGLGKQQATASPHGSPRHKALARLTKPAQEIVRKVINLPPKTELLEAVSPKLSPKVSREDAKEIEEILCIPKIGLSSPKRNFYLNQNANPSPGYHNPYQQAGLIKSPLVAAGDTKFRFDHLSPKPAVDNHSNGKPPTSPRRFFSSRESLAYDEAKTSEGSNCANDNDRSENRTDCRQKSRLPLKVPYLRDMKKIRPSSPLLVDVDAESRSNSSTIRSGTETRSEVVTDCNTNILINDVPSSDPLSGSRENPDQTGDEGNTNNTRNFTDGQQIPNECTFSHEWNSTELSITNGNSAASWNSDRSDCDQKMSIEEKSSLKQSSVDSLRPRTNSCGSLSHSNASGEKSSSSASLAASGAGVELPSDTDSGMADSVSSKMVIIKCKGGTYLSRIFLNNGGIQGVKVVGRVGGVPSPCPQLSSSPHPPSAAMSAAPSPVHLPTAKSVGGGSESADSAAGSCGPDSCCVSGSDRPVLHEGEFDHDTADYQWLLDYDEGFTLLPSPSHPSPDSGHDSPPSIHLHESYASIAVSSPKLSVFNDRPQTKDHDSVNNYHFSDVVGGGLLNRSRFDNLTKRDRDSQSASRDESEINSYLVSFEDSLMGSEINDNLQKSRDFRNEGLFDLYQYSQTHINDISFHLIESIPSDVCSSSVDNSDPLQCKSSPHRLNQQSHFQCFLSPPSPPPCQPSKSSRQSPSLDRSAPIWDSKFYKPPPTSHPFIQQYSIPHESLPPNSPPSDQPSLQSCKSPLTCPLPSQSCPLPSTCSFPYPPCCPSLRELSPTQPNPSCPAGATNCPRYRESYTRESLGAGGRDGLCRASVLDTNPEPNLQDLSYETLSRHLDANLAEIDMDDFRSDDINQLLALPSVCAQCQRQDRDGEDGGGSVEPSANNTPTKGRRPPVCQHNAWQCQQYEEYDLEEEEFSGVSGDISLYQSEPLFSPLKDPPPIGNTTFSVDSLDCESLHEDLILTCQANKDNYTIAFEGSFIQYSEDSDYHEAGESDTTGSGSWPADRLEGGQSPAPAMTHSDQPYTTWSRVGRKSSTSPSCRTPDPAGTHKSRAAGSHLSPAARQQLLHKQHQQQQQQHQQQQAVAVTAVVAAEETREENSSKSNSMPNLMRRSLLRQSLEAGGQCIKVFDLQNSLRSSHSSARHTDGNSFSLVRLFMKQKSLSKEAISLSSSCTSRSHEGACCSSSENQSAVDSSDWPMNSQSDDMEGSASPVPHSVMRNNQAIIERGMRRRSGGDINPRNVNSNSGDFGHNTSDIISPTGATTLMETDGGSLVNNNNAVNQILDNTGTVGAFDNTANFEESLKEVCPCSKPPMTSPIREEPEGMDISFDSRCENKLVNDQSESETKSSASVTSVEKNTAGSNSVHNSPSKERSNDIIKGSPNKNVFAVQAEARNRSQSPATPKRSVHRRDSSQRQRQNSGNSSSGYASTKGSTERLRSTSDSHTPQHTPQRPRPKPRALKQMSDQCLQTSNLKVSATMNTSNLMDRKDIYVYYPNYALPDLSFLKDKKYSVDSRIFLVPQHYRRPAAMTRKAREGGGRRPFSCNDMERLRKRGLSHIKDWESLNVLLPKELKEMLSDNSDCMETVKPSYCISPKSPRRPNSCDFGAAKSSNSNTSLSSTQPSSGYRGSSTMLNDSESTQQQPQNLAGEDAPSVPRRSVSLPLEEGGVDGENPPPRPPLPRGILRKVTSLRDDSSQKTGVKKRYSAADSPDRLSREESVARRRSLPESMESGKDELQQQPLCRTDGDGGDDSAASEMSCSCITTCTGFCGKGLRKKNLLPVSELPNVSSHEEFTEEDLVALRSRVSNFLVGKNLTEENTCDWCPKKSVSFAGQSCQHVHQTVESANDAPNKSEERPVVYDAQDKKTLVMSVRVAVEKLVSHFSHLQGQAAKPKFNSNNSNNTVAQITLDKLCPAVYALLSDGLQPSLHSLFGKIANSVWKMIEATSQMGPATKALSDLVLTLNSEDCLSEGPMKFNAFIFGLLNIRSLDSWLSYLRTRESILQKHYHPEAFLYLANTATRNLYDDLLLAVRPLSLLPLHLDLLYEYKLLHASLLKMEERLMLHTSSTGNSPGDRPSSALLDHLLVAKETKEFKNTAAAQQDRVKALMKVLASPEATESDLLQTVAASVTKERSRSPRPRSCYDNAAAAGDDLHPALKKRWSNVQLGSKLITAIDKLMLEEVNAASGSSEDYTDSIDNPKVPRVPSQNSEDEATLAAMRDSDISTKEDDISERSATDKDTENEKGQRVCPTSLAFGKGKESEGEKFRRLQLKWELMTGCELPNKCKDADTSDATEETTSFEDTSGAANTAAPAASDTAVGSATSAASPSQTAREKVVSPSSGSRSRIPRPVSMTSPQRPFKVFEPSKEKTSPQIKPPLHSRPFGSSPLTGKDLPKPAPRRSLKDKSDDSNNSRPMSIRSRVSPKVGGANVVATGNRASSMPGRSDSVDRGSSSHSSAGGSGRYVQTLHHRLATDNGHLSFNRGDSLQVVVEVDDRYLLCCLNGRKGLVPRASVIACGDQ